MEMMKEEFLPPVMISRIVIFPFKRLRDDEKYFYEFKQLLAEGDLRI